MKINLIDDKSKSEDSDENEVAFLVKYMLEQHKLKCNKIVCFCKKSRIKIESSSFTYYSSYFEGNFIFEALNLISDLLKDTIKVKREDTDYIFYCYIYFLTYFLN